VQILWWLAPPVVATVLAMLWVTWLGREGRGAVDPEVAARRLGRAMSRASRVTARPGTSRTPSRSDRSSGIAVRSSSRPSSAGADETTREARTQAPDDQPESTRRAS
jgi:hypothetical protein